MTRAALIVCTLVTMVLAAATSRDAAAQQPAIEGVYTFDATASDDIKAAINAAVSNMNFIVKPIARSRLTKTNPAYQRISITREGTEIVVAFDTRKPVRMPADGTSIKWTREDGEKFDVKVARQDTQLTQTFVAEDGQRVNDFRLEADPNMMTLHITLTSEKLDKPMVYKLAYKRAPSNSQPISSL
jgi:hypothetical protein